jgi:hypothetical protein
MNIGYMNIGEMAAFWIIAGILMYSYRYWQAQQRALQQSPFRVMEYKNVNHANLGIAAMDRDGWTVKSMDTTEGHINVGRTATYTILTGGLALFLGGSRSKGKVAVMYERKPITAPRTTKATATRTTKKAATAAASVKRTRTRKPSVASIEAQPPAEPSPHDALSEY